MGGQREERFSGRLRGVENQGEGMSGVETIGGDGSKTGLVKKKGKKSTTCVGASLTPDYREKEESNQIFILVNCN